MKTKLITVLIVLASLYSCNDAVKEKSIKEEPPKKLPQLEVEASLKVSKNADIKFFTNNMFLNNDQEMNISITHKLKVNPEFKKLVFKFPENLIPDNQLGLSFGSKHEKEIEINQVTLSYADTKFVIEPDDLEDYFVFNKFIEMDSVTNKLVTKKLGNAHNPMIFFRRKILDSLQYIQ